MISLVYAVLVVYRRSTTTGGAGERVGLEKVGVDPWRTTSRALFSRAARQLGGLPPPPLLRGGPSPTAPFSLSIYIYIYICIYIYIYMYNVYTMFVVVSASEPASY